MHPPSHPQPLFQKKPQNVVRRIGLHWTNVTQKTVACTCVHTRRLRFETRWLRHFFSPTATLAFVLWRYCFDHALMLIDGCNRHDGCCCTGTWLRARTWREHQTTACQINVQMGAQWKRIQRGIFFTLQRISQATKRPILSRCNLEMR